MEGSDQSSRNGAVLWRGNVDFVCARLVHVFRGVLDERASKQSVARFVHCDELGNDAYVQAYMGRACEDKMILTPEQRALVDGARERSNAATEGPWSVYSAKLGMFMGQRVSVDAVNGEEGSWVSAIITTGHWFHVSEGEVTLPDATFIAHARQDVPALCDLVDELEGRLRERTEAAKSWDALAVARLQTITEYNARIVQLEERLKKAATERETEVSQYEADIERALGPDALGSRRYESGFAPDYIIKLHNHYADRLRVSEEARVRTEHERDTYKRIASIKKSSAKDP